jgi:hypothetical protein
MATEAPERSWHDLLYRWLSAPLLVTIAGALLINLIIPKITSKSQNHQRALEVKTALVRELSGAIADVLTTGRLVATDVIPKTGGTAQAPFNSGLAAWQARQAELGSQLEAYFPHTRIANDWSRYGALATDLYFLSGTGVEERAVKAEELRKGLAARRWCMHVSAQDWQTLTTENEGHPDRSSDFHRSYIAVDQCLLSHGDDLVRSVLAQDPRGF